MIKYILLMLISTNAFSMDADEAHRIAVAKESKQIKTCVKATIKSLEASIPHAASRGKFESCTNQCDFNKLVFNQVGHYFNLKRYTISFEGNDICASWENR